MRISSATSATSRCSGWPPATALSPRSSPSDAGRPTANTAACSTRCGSTARNTRACRPARSRRTSLPCASCGSCSLRVLDLGGVRVELAARELGPRPRRQLAIARPVALQVILLELFEIEQRVVRTLRRPDQLVELDLDRFRIAVLRVLDHEHHQESYDGGRGVDHELPGVAVAEERPGR